MSGGIFYLDEERDKESSPSPSPRPSPRASPTLAATDPRSSPLSLPAASSSSNTAPASIPVPPILHVPTPVSASTSTLLPSQPQSIARKHAGPFAATPSFPSPLAQAITVPTHSDTSSSGSHTDSDDDANGEREGEEGLVRTTLNTPTMPADSTMPRPRTASPHTSRSGSPASTQKSISRPPSPRGPQIMTPGSLLMKSKRSASGSLLSGSLPGPTPMPKDVPTRVSPTHPGARRLSNAASSPSTFGHRRGSSGSNASLGIPPSAFGASSPLAFGSPELEPLLDDSPTRSLSLRASSTSPVRGAKEPNVLGLGWTSGIDSPGGSRDKGKAKDTSGSGSLSPRVSQRDRDRTAASTGMASPPRQRRPSEFLNPSGDSRKMPIVGGPRASISSAHIPSLSTSASMISPLNPLPSPWAKETEPSPFSAPKSLSSELSSSTSTSSVGGAIRLNRVPTSVRMAADLIKNSGPVPPAPSSAPSTSSTASVPTPNPSPAGSVPTQSSMPPPPPRELGPFTSMPIPGAAKPANSNLIDLGKGRPTLSVPPTPRHSTPVGSSPGTTVGGADLARKPSGSTLAPPSAFKAPLPPQPPRTRPSLPPDPVSSNAQSDSFPSKKTHRYRTSMHEATFKRSSSLLSESPPALAHADAPGTGSSIKPLPLGLGLNVPSGAARLTANLNTDIGSGSITPGGPIQPRQRSTTGKALQMDLAGIGALGDAASHASMIMQSRQAKLQRWRPNSAGKQDGQGRLLPPAFNRSTTTGAPAMLAGPRMDRQNEWGVREGQSITAASSPGEDLPPFPSATHQLGRVESLPIDSMVPPTIDHLSTKTSLKSNAGPSRFSASPAMATGMERQASAGGSIGGIEWIDWYDCYKGYKEAKIRAEAQTARRAQHLDESPLDESQAEFSSAAHSPVETSRPRDIDLSSNYDASSAIALTPSTSRDELGGVDNRLRRRSLSIRSAMSSLDPTRSPTQKRNSFFERPRQTSGSSVRSAAESISSGNGNKKKKNLVNKMEGWWNAVKSNFIPEGQLAHRPMRPSNLGVYPSQRIPSAPVSRRGSGHSPITAPQAALLPPEPIRRDSSQSLRQVTSHAELRPWQYDSLRLQAAASIVSSTSADIARLSRESTIEPMAHAMNRAPSMVPEEPSGFPSRVPSSLETRRKGQGGPNLRLDLESNVLVQPRSDSRLTASSGSGGQPPHVPPHLRSTATSSRTSSYGQTMYGPGLTPGLPKWDQTPSPIYALSGDSRGDKEDRPVAPGAEITVASVRRHIKHRLNAAKETCDNTLKKAIDNMTRFADEQKAAQIMQAELDDQPLDYFDAISDSPLVDAEESEVEGGDMFDDGFRSRQASTSRPPSRRPSISRPLNFIGASPTKRLAMLPSSPSRVRRRPSAVPRSFPGQPRLPRSGMAVDRTVSAASSRSTSRSRSPMPTSTRGVHPATEEAEENRLFLATLQDLIVLATEILDSSVNTLITKAGTCAEYVQKLQRIGVNWDEHEDWPGREWYVDILMAVANLSRVLDWWQAEKGFWNFDEEDDNEPIVFVMKPQGTKEDSRFDKEFGAALTEHRHSPVSATVQVLEPPSTGALLEVPSPTSTLGSGGIAAKATIVDTPKNATAAEDLKFLAEHAKSVNIVMELGLQEEEIQYVNDAIMEVIGRDPEDVLNSPITDLLAPADMTVFAEATQKLLEDDNNTVQLRFRFEVHELEKEAHPPLQPGPVYIELEGVGMLMRENNEPSHTMWVLKPVTATQLQLDSVEEAAFPSVGVLSTEAILCRICEREIVTWFFEKHNETCDAVHRLEAEITGCNECLHELQQTVSGLQADIEDVTSGSSPQYSGVLFFSLPDSITSGHESSIPTEPQGVEVRKVVLESIQDVLAIVTLAQQIDVPSVQEDEADLPFNVQRYLSRESEEKLQKISRWQKPSTSDRALALLFSHVEEQLRRKQKAIARMQSTIRYSEKTRHEWEDKVSRLVVDGDGDESSPSESGSDGAASLTEATSPAPTPANEPESSPPGPRKIAPQARLPITQSHPQRPSTSHGEQSYTSIPPTPVHATNAPTSVLAAPNSAPLPAEAVFQSLTAVTSPSAMKPRKAESKPVSPLLAPMDALSIGGGGSHSRRASSSRAFRDAPLSPRIPSAAIPARTAQPSIKDFEIIKPISRGAFGSVYLAKKVATGDYFAIKALKKSDMIAKNQITNVKAERTILMNQASSPYVAKLFFSFQSKEYLYLVMEYLNGGDCSTLVKTLGGLPEEWARNYTAEVVLGLEYLHARNIVHRDIKPDNLLIDSRGHLKLTDFGLSRIGLLNRQVGGPRPAYLRGTNLRGSMKRRPTNNRNDSGSSAESSSMSPELLPAPPMLNRGQSYFSGIPDIDTADESSGSESAGVIPRHMRTMSVANKSNGPGTPPRFVGTPDYLAPESILGIGTDDKAVDWWALGVVLYEFIYGIPPFHADTPEKVFDNVVSRRIEWHEEDIEVSPAARDLMDRLMCSDPTRRLGARGADEVKQHAFFAGIDWATIATSEASFVPEVADPESTDYFDPRGAAQTFQDDGGVQVLKQPETAHLANAQTSPISTVASKEMNEVIDDIESQDDFGAFNFKNLPVLKQANDDVIRKLRSDSMTPIGQALEGGQSMARRPRSLSIKLRDRGRRKPSDSTQASSHLGGPPSPSTSTSSAASTPSRASVPPSTPGSMPIPGHHFRRPSELNALERVKSSQDSDVLRRASAPSRIRAGSGSSFSERSTQVGMWKKKRQVSLNSEANSAASGVHAILPPLESPESHASFASGHSTDRTLDVLIAEDNPISQKILETLLTRMGCRCICVEDGPQALAATMGSIRFDVIICDIHMPVVSGEQVARMIRSTNNHNQNTPIIAATSYEQHQEVTEEGTLFSAVLAKPVTKPDLLKCLGKLGFILSSSAGSAPSTDGMSVSAQA